MKITHVVTSLKIGGAERFVIDLCELQKNKKYDINIISFGKKDEPLIEVCAQRNINIILINTNIFKRNVIAYKKLRNNDVIHLHSPYALKTLILPLLFLFYKTIIYTRHGEASFSELPWRYLHKIAQLIINHVTFVSEKGRDIFLKTQNLNHTPHHVIENGVSGSDIIINQANHSDKLRLGSVGRMVKLKNQISLLKAILLLNEEQRAMIEIHFYGDGECLEELQKFTNLNHLNQVVTFHGMITDRHYIYNHFDILIVTSETEGLSLAIIEAMMYSKPVIATDVGGNPRLVIDDKTGYLFDYNDNMALKNLIYKFIDNDKMLNQIGNNAKKYVEDNFSLENTAKKYFKLYKEKSV